MWTLKSTSPNWYLYSTIPNNRIMSVLLKGKYNTYCAIKKISTDVQGLKEKGLFSEDKGIKLEINKIRYIENPQIFLSEKAYF